MAKALDNRAWLLVLPALVILGCVAIIPLLTTVNYSFHDIFSQDYKFWVGAEWYREILGSARFWGSFGRSLLFSAIILLIEIPLGIYIAIQMPKRSLWVAVCLVLMSLPLLVPWNIIPMIWKTFISPAYLGGAFSAIGIDFNWKAEVIDTWFAIVLMDVWHWTSLVVLLCYSGLTTIPAAYYNAAAIDRASRWAVLRYIELPKLSSVLMMAILLRFMDSFMIYTEAFRLNAGGPGYSTTFMAMELGEDIFAFNYGPAAARSVICFIIILTVSWLFKTALAIQQADSVSSTLSSTAEARP